MTNDKKMINGWISDVLPINQSPFHKDSHYEKYIRDAPMEKISFRIPKTAYNDLLTYFKGMGMEKSEGFKKILTDKLEMINTSKRTIFNNSELIMVIPKTRSLSELNDKSFILTLYNVKTDFKKGFIYQDGFNKTFNINYELEDFGFFFPMDILRNLNKDVIFNSASSNPYVKGDFQEYHKRLEEFHELMLSDCYFVRFPLNNYLDINRDGQYQSSRLKGWHEGIYAFDDFNQYRLHFKLEWRYDNSGLIHFRGEFIPLSEFMFIVKNADMKNVRDCHESLLKNSHDREFMESSLRDAEEMKDWIENQIAFYKKNLGR